jgi:hypothetical protein
MLDEKPHQPPKVFLEERGRTHLVEELQNITYEFLALTSNLPHPQSSEYLAILASLLHLMTDLETQLAIARTALEQERLIHNAR